VPDTKSKIRFANNNKKKKKKDIQYIIGPYEELGLTRALELKESSLKDATITAINVGGKDTEPTLRKALAVGADDAIRIDANPEDAMYVAKQIAEVAKLEKYDIIIAGKESIDYNGAMVGAMIAEFLDIPLISSTSKIDFIDGNIVLEREIDGGKEILTSTLPLVTTAQKGFALEPRIPAMRGIMLARKKILKVVQPVDQPVYTKVINHDLPVPKGKCKMIPADKPEDLIRLLHEEAKVI